MSKTKTEVQGTDISAHENGATLEGEAVKPSSAGTNTPEILPAPVAETVQKARAWLSQMDQCSISQVRKKYPIGFWLVGGIVIGAIFL